MVGHREQRQRPGARHEPARHVLGVEAALDRVPVEHDVLLREAKRLSVGDVDLQLDQIAAGDGLGDRVLDLDPAVDLEEEVLAGVDVEDELDRAQIAVPDRLRERDRFGGERVARRGVEIRRGRLLDHLLVAALHRAVALA